MKITISLKQSRFDLHLLLFFLSLYCFFLITQAAVAIRCNNSSSIFSILFEYIIFFSKTARRTNKHCVTGCKPIFRANVFLHVTRCSVGGILQGVISLVLKYLVSMQSSFSKLENSYRFRGLFSWFC